jgi:hypothetical protein
MNTWSIKDTQNHIEVRFGENQLVRAAPSLYSLARRLDFARYHYREFQRLFSSFTQLHLTTKPLFIVMYSGNKEDRDDFEDLMTGVGAHATACVLSIHSLSDVLAYAVYYALGLDLEKSALSDREISIDKVVRRLRKIPAHAAIADALSNMCANSSYIHIANLANCSKHQSIVRPNLNEDLTGLRAQQHEFRFSAFHLNGKDFPETTFELVLKPAYDLMCRTVIDVGNMLNDILKEATI